MRRLILAPVVAVLAGAMTACDRPTNPGAGATPQPQVRAPDIRAKAFAAWDKHVANERARVLKVADEELDSMRAKLKVLNDEWDKLREKKPRTPAIAKRIEELDAEVTNLTELVRNTDKAKAIVAKTWEPRTDPRSLKAGECAKFGVRGQLDKVPVFVIQQVIDADNAILRFGDESFWFRVNTGGWVDGRTVSFDHDVIECEGPKQYETAIGGTKTVMSFRVHGPPPK